MSTLSMRRLGSIGYSLSLCPELLSKSLVEIFCRPAEFDKSFRQEFPTRVSDKSFRQEFPTRVSDKSFRQEFSTIGSRPSLSAVGPDPNHPLLQSAWPKTSPSARRHHQQSAAAM